MLGVMGLWMGLMEIAREAGIVRKLSEWLQPLIRFLFPKIPADHPAGEHITMNCVANLLGLGWAATPAGLKAMEELEKLEEERRQQAEDEQEQPEKWQRAANKQAQPEKRQQAAKDHPKPMPRGTASNEMCTFLILNISSLQLIPVSVIAYRSQYGSPNPTAIVGPGIAATAVSTVTAVLFCKMMDLK
jgi:spore maturation protein A